MKPTDARKDGVTQESSSGASRGAPHGVLGRLYARFGARYPRTALAVTFELLLVAFLVGLGVLTIYVDVTFGDFMRLALVTFVLHTVYTGFFMKIFAEMIGPIEEWLEADRPWAGALPAWHAAASLPFRFLATMRSYGVAAFAIAIWSAYAVWELDLPTIDFLAVFSGAVVVQLYTTSLFFFVAERIMRPILEDTAHLLSEVPRFEAPTVSLRVRLLATLPALNLVTGVLVAGLSSPDDVGLNDLRTHMLIAAAVAFTVSLALSLLLADSIATPIRHLRDATDRVAEGDLAARVPVLATDEPGRLAEAFNNMSVGLEERERLRDAFGAFVDKDLAERVLREGTDLAGEDVVISVLFLDVRGFTAMSERASAREVVAKLNDLWAEVVPAVIRNGGHANKFIGDGMLAIFGAPQRHSDHADRAVAAALEIAQSVNERFKGEMRVGIGVNTGQVLVGTIGGGGRLDFTVIGDPVNTASRVESATRQTGDEVLVTEATYGCLTRHFGGFEERLPLTLKGKSDPVRVYAPRLAGGAVARATDERDGSGSGL